MSMSQLTACMRFENVADRVQLSLCKNDSQGRASHRRRQTLNEIYGAVHRSLSRTGDILDACGQQARQTLKCT